MSLDRRNFLKLLGVGAAAIATTPSNVYANGIESKTNREEFWNDIRYGVEKLKNKFNLKPDEKAIIIDPSKQYLHLIQGDKILKSYSVSTSKTGLGFEPNSNKTPYGTHRIKEKIGDNQEIGKIFKSRIPTKDTAQILKEKIDVPDDSVTTRIMWLSGQEEMNRNSHGRYIYIHGTPEEGLIGEPASHGCIRMKNDEVQEVYDILKEGSLVEILDKKYSTSK